jgi:hypothetical protein
LHMGRDSSSIERDPYSCLVSLVAQSFPRLHISMCIAQRRVQPVLVSLREEAAFFCRLKTREDWLQRERQGAGQSPPARW